LGAIVPLAKTLDCGGGQLELFQTRTCLDSLAAAVRWAWTLGLESEHSEERASAPFLECRNRELHGYVGMIFSFPKSTAISIFQKHYTGSFFRMLD
jgi:hypothetical protein